MKKILTVCFLFFFLFLTLNVNSQSLVLDQNNNTDTGDTTFGQTRWVAQVFTIPKTRAVGAITLKLHRAIESGFVRVSIYDTNSNLFPRNPLSNCSAVFPAGQIPSSSAQKDFNLSYIGNNCILDANAVYSFVINSTGGSSTTDYLYRVGNGNPYAPNFDRNIMDEYTSLNSGLTWARDTNDDFVFKIWTFIAVPDFNVKFSHSVDTNKIYDFNFTGLNGQSIRDYNWFVNTVRKKTSTMDGNLHYGLLNTVDNNITLIIKNTFGETFQKEKFIGQSIPNIIFSNYTLANLLSTGNQGNMVQLRLKCSYPVDTVKLDYVLTLNDVNVYSFPKDVNSVLDSNFLAVQGINSVKWYCLTANEQDINTASFTAFSTNFFFAFDHNGSPLVSSTQYATGDINNVFIYSHDNNSFLNLISLGKVAWFYSGGEESSFQVKIGYNDITFPFTSRDFQLGTLDVNSVPVCFSNLQNFYQNIFYSSIEREIRLTNINNGCHHFAAKTKYAFGDSLALSAFLIPLSYKLVFIDDFNVTSTLAVVDGGSVGQINVDGLILKKESALEIIIAGEAATILKDCGGLDDCNTFVIRYRNAGANNSSVTATIFNGTVQQFSYIESVAPNNFSTTFSSTDLNFMAEILKLKIVANRTDGSSKTFFVYFTPQGQVGYIDPAIAVILSFAIFVIGITLVSSRLVFGWFGALVALMALAFLSFSVGVWWISFMQAIMLSLLVYISISFHQAQSGAN